MAYFFHALHRSGELMWSALFFKVNCLKTLKHHSGGALPQAYYAISGNAAVRRNRLLSTGRLASQPDFLTDFTRKMGC